MRVTRRAVDRLLGSYAPALDLLPREERRRARALAAYGGALFERARSGDRLQDPDNRDARLASIGRLAELLERALAGEPVQGAAREIHAMVEAGRTKAWAPRALGELHAAARHRAVTPRERDPRSAAEAACRLADALVDLLLGPPSAPAVGELGGALLRLSGLRRLGEELREGRCPLPVSEVAEPDRAALRDLIHSVRAECSRLRPALLGVGKDLPSLPVAWHRATAYLLLVSLHLLTEIEEADSFYLDDPPRVGVARRLALLAKARWLGLDAFEV